MSKHIQEETRAEIDIAACLSKEVYDSKYFEIDEVSQNTITIPGSSEKYTVIATSMNKEHGVRKLAAFAVRDSKNNIYIVYRGTGDGKWIDNAIGIVKDSPIQDEALAFYNRVVQSEVINNPHFNGRLIVTGHSKGGNLAQYVTMASPHGNLVDNCYSIDGQGFSNDTYERFLKMEDYADRIDKMYSINGQNDYVDPLGKVIIPEERTFFVKNIEFCDVDKFNFFHKIDYIMTQDGLNWDYTEVNGERIYNYDLESGPVNKLIREISDSMMELSEEEIEDCALTIMFLVESTIGDINEIADGYRDSITYEEGIGFINVGIPLLIDIIRNSENTTAAFEAFGLDMPDWLLAALYDILLNLSKDMTVDELEGYVALGKEISNYAASKNLSLNQLLDYIKEDPLRIIELCASLGMDNITVVKALGKFFSLENVATFLGSFANAHPGIAALGAAAISHPLFGPIVLTVAKVVASVAVVALVINHIVVNWEKIKAAFHQAMDYIKDKIVDFYNELKERVRVEANQWISAACLLAEKISCIGSRVGNAIAEAAEGFWSGLKTAATSAVKSMIFNANPLLYGICATVYRVTREPVSINYPVLKDCVERMNNLAWRVSNLDQRLDDLYWRLAQDNIEQEEGLFTSLAKIYNLFRADLNVDEGGAIKRRAVALSELFEGYESAENWVINRIPQKS